MRNRLAGAGPESISQQDIDRTGGWQRSFSPNRATVICGYALGSLASDRLPNRLANHRSMFLLRFPLSYRPSMQDPPPGHPGRTRSVPIIRAALQRQEPRARRRRDHGTDHCRTAGRVSGAIGLPGHVQAGSDPTQRRSGRPDREGHEDPSGRLPPARRVDAPCSRVTSWPLRSGNRPAASVAAADRARCGRIGL
jgi:hypothetical protein